MSWWMYLLAIWGAGAVGFFAWQIVMYAQFWFWWNDNESRALREEMRQDGTPHVMMVLMMLFAALWWPISLPLLSRRSKEAQ